LKIATPQLAEPILSDDLGKLVEEARKLLLESASFDDFLRSYQGPSDFHEDVGSIPHPAATLLEHYRTQGTSVDTPSKPWTDAQKQEALQCGVHKSSYNHLDFVREEFADFVHKKYWVVLPAADVLMLEWLMLSPLGVVP